MPFVKTCHHRRLAKGRRYGWQVAGPRFRGLAYLMGMGGAQLSALATEAITSFSPDLIILTGFGGALTAASPPPDLVVATACWRLSPDGGQLEQQEFPAAVPSIADLVAELRHRGLPAVVGSFITTPRMTAKALVLPLASYLPAPVLDLETAAVAAVAQAQNLPLLAVRAITDGSGEEIQGFLAQIIDRHRGVPLSRLLPALLAHPTRLQYICHLWERSRRAGLNLAIALHHILAYLAELRITH